MKHYLATWLLSTVCAAALLSVPADAKEKVPPGSFLTARASSVEALADQVRKDPRVAQRYARHFKVEPGKVADYITSELKLVSLQRPLRVTVWFIAKDGSITSKPRVLPAGSMVFSNREGKPVFLWICGNPLRDDLPRPPAPPAQEVTVPEHQPESPIIVEEQAPPASAAPGFLPQQMAPSTAVRGLDTLISPPVPAMPPAAQKRRPPLWLLGLLASGGRSAAEKNPDYREPPVVVVPEVPAGALSALGLPVAAGLARLRRRRSGADSA
mgnify:CR=1 FL=1